MGAFLSILLVLPAVASWQICVNYDEICGETLAKLRVTTPDMPMSMP